MVHRIDYKDVSLLTSYSIAVKRDLNMALGNQKHEVAHGLWESAFHTHQLISSYAFEDEYETFGESRVLVCQLEFIPRSIEDLIAPW